MAAKRENDARGNAPTPPVRLSLAAASREFVVPLATLHAKLTSTGTKCGADKRFSIKQVYEALIPDHRKGYNEEKQRLMREQADRIALENEATRGAMIAKADVYEGFAPIFEHIRRVIMGSKLTDDEKDQIFAELRRFNEGDLFKKRHDDADAEPSGVR